MRGKPRGGRFVRTYAWQEAGVERIRRDGGKGHANQKSVQHCFKHRFGGDNTEIRLLNNLYLFFSPSSDFFSQRTEKMLQCLEASRDCDTCTSCLMQCIRKRSVWMRLQPISGRTETVQHCRVPSSQCAGADTTTMQPDSDQVVRGQKISVAGRGRPPLGPGRPIRVSAITVTAISQLSHGQTSDPVPVVRPRRRPGAAGRVGPWTAGVTERSCASGRTVPVSVRWTRTVRAPARPQASAGNNAAGPRRR